MNGRQRNLLSFQFGPVIGSISGLSLTYIRDAHVCVQSQDYFQHLLTAGVVLFMFWLTKSATVCNELTYTFSIFVHRGWNILKSARDLKN